MMSMPASSASTIFLMTFMVMMMMMVLVFMIVFLIRTVLRLPELPVDGVIPGQELTVRPLLHHAPLVQDQDLVAVGHSGQPVGDDDGGAAARGLLQGPHDAALCDGIQARGRLVKD